MWRRLGSNMVANLMLGASAAAYQAGLAAVASRALGEAGFAIWAFAASIAVLVPVFTLNLSSAIVRRLLKLSPLPDSSWTQPLAAGRDIARTLTLVAVGAMMVAAVSLTFFHRDIFRPGDWSGPIVLILLAIGFANLVSTQAEQAENIARHRNWSNTAALAGGRALSLALAVAAAMIWPRAETIAAAAAVGMMIGAIWLRRMAPLARAIPPAIKGQGSERSIILHLTSGLAVWSMSMGLIQYGAVPIGALIAPSSATSLYLASTLVALGVGAITAVTGAMLAPIGQRVATADNHGAARLTLFLAIAIWLVALAGYGLTYLLLPVLLPAWVGGHADVETVRGIFLLFALQQSLRSLGAAASTVVAMVGATRHQIQAVALEMSMVALLAWPAAHLGGLNAFLLLLSVAALTATTQVAYRAARLLKLENRGAILAASSVVAASVFTVAYWFAVGSMA